MVTFREANRLLFLMFCSGLTILHLPTTSNAFQSKIPTKNSVFEGLHISGDNWRRKNVGEERQSIFNSNGTGHYNQYHATKISAATTDNESQSEEGQGLLIGTLVLLTVPLSWGTYVPVVRYLYAIKPAVPGFVFSACYYTLAAATTTLLAQRQLQSQAQPTSITVSSDNSKEGLDTNNDSTKASFFSLNKGGLELGSYLFVANCLQVIGLQTVESDRAGFLVQLTTVMVPICEGLFAGNIMLIPARTWFACVMAFLGLCIMGLDGKQTDAIDALTSGNPWETFQVAASSLSQGDSLILGAAVLYTLHVVRLGTYARQTTPMKLAASKATTESILSFGLIFLLVGLSTLQESFHLLGDSASSEGLLKFSLDTGREITTFFSSFSAGISDGSITTSVLLPAFGSILWTGWITCAYTIWAQSFGQSKVSPTSANLIYTFQPIFTALFAYVLLGEKMGSVGFLGGAIIASAVYIVASNDGDNGKNAIEQE